MVNPFDLSGPLFLLFYLALGVMIVLIAFRMRRASEANLEAPLPLHDYLDIAFLRGGAAEAVRVAVLTLLDRGLLRIADSRRVEAVGERAARLVSKSTERQILERCRTASEARTLLTDTSIMATVTAECAPGLVRQGLLPDARQRAYRRRLLVGSASVLLIVALVKIAVAFSRGRSNIEFLIAETVAFVFVAYAVTHPQQTTSGSSLLVDMRSLFAGLRDGVTSFPQGGSHDFALLAAVFGMPVALPHHPEARVLFPSSDSTSGASDSPGSSCGSSCGGGGGCGGCGS